MAGNRSHPKTSAAGGPSSPKRKLSKSAIPEQLRKLVARFTKEIREEHGFLDRDMADHLSRQIRSGITRRRKPGRQTTPEVLKAVELRRQGVPWPKVYKQVFPGYWTMDLADRFWRAHKPRDAVRSHHRRRNAITKRDGGTVRDG